MSSKKNNSSTDAMEEKSVFDDLVFDQDVQLEDLLESEAPVSEKKRSRYASIIHNGSEAYKDKSKVAELGVDLFPGFSREMELAAIERGNKNFYLTGLDESLYKEQWEKDFLNESLVILEKNFGKEIHDPFNHEFWKTRTLVIRDDEVLLDLENPENLLTYWNIKGGGYPFVAKSPDELARLNVRFYLSEPHLEYSTKGNDERLKDKAIALLTEIDEGPSGFSTMFFVHKNLITSNEGITMNTPKKLIYASLRRYIDGDYAPTNRKKMAPKLFIEAVNLYKNNSKKATTIAIVNDSIYFGKISTNKDNQFISNITSHNFRTTDKAKLIDVLMSPANQDELSALYKEVKLNWNKLR